VIGRTALTGGVAPEAGITWRAGSGVDAATRPGGFAEPAGQAWPGMALGRSTIGGAVLCVRGRSLNGGAALCVRGRSFIGGDVLEAGRARSPNGGEGLDATRGRSAGGCTTPVGAARARSPAGATGARLGASRYPHTPQNRAFGSSGELHDGHVMSTNFRRTLPPWHATFQQNARASNAARTRGSRRARSPPRSPA